MADYETMMPGGGDLMFAETRDPRLPHDYISSALDTYAPFSRCWDESLAGLGGLGNLWRAAGDPLTLTSPCPTPGFSTVFDSAARPGVRFPVGSVALFPLCFCPSLTAKWLAMTIGLGICILYDFNLERERAKGQSRNIGTREAAEYSSAHCCHPCEQ
jgi:hypothetical protein